MGVAALVTRSVSIFAGTVDRAWVDSDRRVHVPVNRSIFKDVVVVKGPKLNRIRVAFWTDEPSKETPGIEKTARLHVGGRYIVLTSESPDPVETGYATVTSRTAGLYPVIYDSRRQRAVVHDSAGRPIVAIKADRMIVVDLTTTVPGDTETSRPTRARTRNPWIDVLPASEDPNTRIDERDFLQMVRELLGSQAPDGTATRRRDN